MALFQIIDYLERQKATSERSSALTETQKNIKIHSCKLHELMTQIDSKYETDWNLISAHNLRHRHTANICFAMWNVYLHPNLNRNGWTKDDDSKLLESATNNKFQNWPLIAAVFDNRSDYQCFLRYTALNSVIQDKFLKWSKEEDFRLLQIVKKYSMNGVIPWNRVASHFTDRSKQQCHRRYVYSINPSINHGKTF